VPATATQHLGATYDGQALLAGDDQLRVVALDRGRDHDDLRILHVLGPVADEGLDALIVQAPDVVVVGRVRTLHRVAQIVHDLGDARHADAADTDEVNGTKLRRQFHGFFPLLFE
jgi:hypothetical protein